MKNFFLALFLSICCLFLVPSCDSDSGDTTKTYKNVTDYSDFNQDYRALCCDGTGCLYVAATYTLYKINTAGISSLFAENIASGDPFNFPLGMTVDGSGSLYVANDENHEILKITGSAVVSTFLGTTGASGSSNTNPVSFNSPYDCTFDSDNNILYVADSMNSKIRKIELGNSNATSDFASVGYVYSVSLDSSGNVYSCSGTGNTIRKHSPAGTLLNTYTITSATAPELNSLAVAGDGTIYAADYANYVIWKVATDGTISLFAGTVGSDGEDNGALLSATFSTITGIEIDRDGTIYIADTNNQKIRRIVLE
ncbi:MAG: hypothetical protein CVV44_21975 [Spirochaetae bacterium HGW-Spirochaetae-1]|jgi:sugar lactone lactonase YvrE|nr:MAG: hypothetical protein CVV44_21975 [Spirochaetae bacterium HGW-Spirochaetae-1]